MQLRFQKWDIVLIAGIALLAVLVLLLFLPGGENPGAQAQIYQNGKLIKTVSLSRDQEFTVTGNCTNTVTVKDGRIAVTRSDCPGEDCVACGWTGFSGRSIVCLPNGLEIRVVGASGDVDFVVG